MLSRITYVLLYVIPSLEADSGFPKSFSRPKTPDPNRVLQPLYNDLSSIVQSSYKKNEDELKFENAPQIMHTEGTFLTEDDFKSAEDLTDADFAYPSPDPTTTSGYLEGDILEDLNSRNAVRGSTMLWPDGTIPYMISKDYDERGKRLIAKAILEYHNKTCIRFKPRFQEKDYLFFTPEGGCASFVGRVGGRQGISLGKNCYLKGVFMHEIMHALGFMHEQSRADRDDYINVIWDNVQSGREVNFKKHDWDIIQDLGESYDYGSILHYDRFAFAKDHTKPTIVPKKKGVLIGQRLGFSPTDVRKLNKLYRCDGEKTMEEDECSDESDICPVLVRSGMCQRDRQLMATKCKKSCHFC